MAFYEVLVPIGISLIFGFGVSYIIERGISWQMFLYATAISFAVMIQTNSLPIVWIFVPAVILIIMLFRSGSDTYE